MKCGSCKKLYYFHDISRWERVFKKYFGEYTLSLRTKEVRLTFPKKTTCNTGTFICTLCIKTLENNTKENNE